MNRTTRVGIIGAGHIVEDAHLPVLLNLPSVEVRWIADANRRRADLLSRMYRVPARPIEPLDALLDEVDACLVAIPVGARKPYLDRCADKGKAVLTEKPFATSAAAHQALCDRFPEHRLGACFQRRFYASLGAIRAVVANRLFGDLREVSFAVGGMDLKSGGPTRYLGDPRLAGGGVIMDLGVHVLDQILHATGATAVDVGSVRGISMEGIDYDAILQTTLQTERGAVAVHGEMTRLRPLSTGFVFTMEHAIVRFGPGPDAILLAEARAGGPAFRLDSPEGGANTTGQAFFSLWTHFIRGLERGERTAASASTSLLTSRWIDGIYAKMGAT